jgi:hypothetical protein
MKPRPAAACAHCGKAGKPRQLDDLHSAEACQSAQSKNRDQAAAKQKQYDSMTLAQRRNPAHNQQAFDQETNDRDNFDAAFQSACIASDDPRLKEK